MRVLATRGSALALAQAELVVSRLRHLDPAVPTRIEVIDSDGDLNPCQPVPELEGQGWFSSRLERALADGRVDAAVHSAKDLPSGSLPGLAVGAYLPREDPRDALVTVANAPWRDLPRGSRVGTASPRRAVQLLALRPDLCPTPTRGNIDSRIRRMEELGLSAVMVARAGLIRLDRAGDGQPLDPHTESTPAPAQGAIAVQVVVGSSMADVVAGLDDPVTRLCVEVEREVLVRMGGGCRLPLGALCEPHSNDGFLLTVAWSPGGAGPDLVRYRVRAAAGVLMGRARRLADQLHALP